MTKADLIAEIASRASLTKAAAERALNALLDEVQEALAGEGKVTLSGFGSFVVEDRKERTGRNPRTGEDILIPASRVVRFRPGKGLKESVN